MNPGKDELKLTDDQRIDVNSRVVESATAGNKDAKYALNEKVKRGEIDEISDKDRDQPSVTVGPGELSFGLDSSITRYADPKTGDVLGDEPPPQGGTLPVVQYSVPGREPLIGQRGPKTNPDAPHNKKIREVSEALTDAGNRILRGGYIDKVKQPEQLINTPGGEKSGRRPDIIYRTPTGETRAVNVGKTEASGQPVRREREALADLNDPLKGNLPTTFVPYDR